MNTCWQELYHFQLLIQLHHLDGGGHTFQARYIRVNIVTLIEMETVVQKLIGDDIDCAETDQMEAKRANVEGKWDEEGIEDVMLEVIGKKSAAGDQANTTLRVIFHYDLIAGDYL